eukprot:TRINITY_DN3167_c0_g2_i1.p1 TRINITY_DN3167_c0_g2~~TRINITY_DN3167_c0_g2_i1.p1  ORF type:complete len:279 (-),score=36.29 TRINITY_DN3167_c0_g2_i1:439-1275(-)
MSVSSLGPFKSDQDILFLGEGDFSFAHSVASVLKSQDKIVATCYDSKKNLKAKYSGVTETLKELTELGVSVFYSVDATHLNDYPKITKKQYDKIVFNFPHNEGALPHEIEAHQRLISNFFLSAKGLLKPNGKILVTIKTSPPYSQWDILKLADKASLVLNFTTKFDPQLYTQYKNKRTANDSTFDITDSETFTFSVPHEAKEKGPPQSGACPGCVKKFHCKVCHVTTVSEPSYALHLQGKKHLKKKMYYGLLSDVTLYCDICKVSTTSLEAYKQHLSG